MINGWEERPLGDVAKLRQGRYVEAELFADAPSGGRVFPFYGGSSIRGYVDFYDYEHRQPFITCRGSNCGLAFLTEEKASVSNICMAIEAEDNILNDFMYYWALASSFEDVISGSAQPQITAKDLSKKEIVFPSNKAEQKAIAEVLSSLDDKIDLLHRQNATLEALAETLFRQFFVEEAQDDWAEATVSDFADHSKTGVKPNENPDILFSHYSLPAFDSGKVPVSEYGRDIRSGKYKVPDNSILISKLNPEVSRIWLIGKQESSFNICSTEFQVAKPSDPNHLPFLYCLFKSKMMRDALTASAGGTSKSHQRVNPADIFGYAFLRPPHDLIDSFAATTKPMFEKLLANQGQIQTLERLRDTLLPKLMSGEVRVQLGNVAA